MHESTSFDHATRVADVASVRREILSIIPQDGRHIGNKNMLSKLTKIFPDITKETYEAQRDALVELGEVKRIPKGNGHCICLTGFDLDRKSAKAKDVLRRAPTASQKRRRKVTRRKIDAVLMENPDDDSPDFIGQDFLAWEDDPFHRVDIIHWQEVSERHRNGQDARYLACSVCLQPIYIRGSRNSHGLHLAHRTNADSYCPVKNQSAGSKGSAYQNMHDEGPTSEDHERVIDFITETIVGQYSLADEEEDPNFPLETVLAELPRLNKGLRAKDGLSYKRPDLYFCLRRPDGSQDEWVIEVQRSKILSDDVIQRTRAHRANGRNILWVSIGELEDSPLSRSAITLQDMHRGCQVFLDKNAKLATETAGVLHLSWVSYEPELDEDGDPVESYRQVRRFPDDLHVHNSIVFARDVTGDTAERRMKERRTRLRNILEPLTKPAGNEVVSQRDALATAQAEELLREVTEFLRDAPDASIPSIRSKAFRSTSVMMTMVSRMVTGDKSRNLTSSFWPSGHYIFNDNPEVSLHCKILDHFAVTSGYASFHEEVVGGLALYCAAPEEARDEFKALGSVEKAIYRAFFGEVFDLPVRSSLASVGRLPAWAKDAEFIA